mmetsp:Transcript_40094/g.71964  ORF Transcript_40094/g.71964 Transcript_40094/m.71964 type:complete len:254 (+) Transcript_40094:206-967(+)
MDGVLEEGCATPWGDEIEHKVLICDAGVGPFVEVDFFHRPTKTLIVTDAVVCVPEFPPEVLDRYNPSALFESAADESLDAESGGRGRLEVAEGDARGLRRRGWAVMCLRVAFLKPITGVEGTFRKLYGRLLVSPLIEILVFSKALPSVRRWCDAISSEWRFERVIPAHYDAPIKAGPADFRRAFDFAYIDETGSARGLPSTTKRGGLSNVFQKLRSVLPTRAASPSLEDEKVTLREIDKFLVNTGVANAPMDD